MEVSRGEYARMRGVSRQAIDNAIQRGVWPLGPGRLINPDAADATWFRPRQARTATAQAVAADEARLARAELTSTIAKLQMTRRRVAQLRAKVVERDAGQARISAIVAALADKLDALAGEDGPDALLLRDAIALVRVDLGDVALEATRLLRE